MGDSVIDEKVKKKKETLINSLVGKSSAEEEVSKKVEIIPSEKERKRERKPAERRRKVTGLTLDPSTKNRLKAISDVEDVEMSRIVEGLVNEYFRKKWEEWDEDVKRFLLKKYPDIAI